MFNQPDNITFLWLIPIFLSILLPISVLPVITLVERMIVVRRKMENKIYVPLGTLTTGREEKRDCPRKTIRGISAFISDGTNCCPGTVDDISQDGIRLINPANIINKESDRLGVLVNYNGSCFALQIKPQWYDKTGQEENIGARIIGGFWNWEEFTELAEEERILT